MAIKFQQKNNQTKTDYLVPAGTHIGRCYKMIHVGTNQYEYNGDLKTKNSIRVSFELPTEMRTFKQDKGEQPLSIDIEYNLTFYEAAKLFKHVNSWRGKTLTPQEIDDFEIDSLIGEPCMLSVTHNVSPKNGKTYANITGVSAMPKGIEAPEQINESFIWDYDTNFSVEAFSEFPNWIQDKITVTPDWAAKQNDLIDSNLLEKVISETNDPNDMPF